VSALGDLYFTSNRTGKPEIYRINNDGKVEQTTNTPDWFASWAPVIKGQNLYFTSNRDGNDSVYLLEGAKAIKVSSAESWTSTLAARYPLSSRYP
jgi:Tol biopolymer transport system component